MKKLLALLAVALFVTSVTGCGCCRRLRDAICRGSRCAAPATMAAPAPIPQAVCPSCPPAPVVYDAGCEYGAQTYGYPMDPMYGSAWTDDCSTCSGGSYTIPETVGPSYFSDSDDSLNGTITPGPAPANE